MTIKDNKDLENLNTIIEECTSITEYIESTYKSKVVSKKIKNGYDIAYNLLKRSSNKKFFTKVFNLSEKLLINDNILDSVVFFDLKQYSKQFYCKVANLVVVKKPKMFLEPKLKQMQNAVELSDNDNDKSILSKKLDSINFNIGAVHAQNGIISEYSKMFRTKIRDTLNKAKKLYDEQNKTY